MPGSSSVDDPHAADTRTAASPAILDVRGVHEVGADRHRVRAARDGLTDDDDRPTTAQVDVAGPGALVTGAASGTGPACAMRLEAAGARVRMVDRPQRVVELLSPDDVRTPLVWVPQDLADDGGSDQDLDVECAGSILGTCIAFGVGGTANGSGAVV